MAKLKTSEDGEEKESKEDGGEDEIFYGAPDEKAWTDKSHAILESEKRKDEGPDLSVSKTVFIFFKL